MTDPRAYAESWMDQAACSGYPERIFFVEEGSRPEPLKIRKAKNFCNACPVKRECLRYALEHETAGSVLLGDAYFVSHWRKTCKQMHCTEHYERDDAPTFKWKEFRASSTPPEGIYGGTTPLERHRKPIKHVELEQGRYRPVCVNGYHCPGCRPLDEWVDMVLEGAE